MPQRFREWGDRWLELNPGWALREWGDGDLDWLKNRELFDRFAGHSRAAQADVARYEILRHHGGLYVDTDVEPLRPLGDLFDGCRLVLAEQFNGALNNAVMASIAEHPFIVRLVDDLDGSVGARGGDGFMESVSPGYLNRTFRRWDATAPEAERAGVRVLDRGVTHPFSWHQRHLAEGPFGDAVAVHHWAVSWSGAGRRSAARRPVGAAAVGGLRRGAVSVRSGWRRAEAAVRRTGRRLATVGEREPHPRRRHHAVPLGDRRLLVQTREGVALVVDADDVPSAAALVRDGTLDPAGIALVRRLLQPGDTAVQLGPGAGLDAIVAAWAVGVTGRVVVRCPDERASALLLQSVAANRADGMHPTLIAVPDAEWADAVATLRGSAELRLVRAPAGPDQARLVRDLLPAIVDGRVRHLDLELSDERAPGARDDVNDLLRDLAAVPRVRAERPDRRGRPVLIDLAAAAHHAEIPHLLVTFPRSG